MKRKKSYKRITIIILVIFVIILTLLIYYYRLTLFTSFTSSNKNETSLINEIKTNNKLSSSLKDKMISLLETSSNIKTESLNSESRQQAKIRVVIKTKNNRDVLREKPLNTTQIIDNQNIIAGEYTIEDINEISKINNVLQIYEDKIYRALEDYNVETIKATPYVNYYMNTFGKGIKVCVLDTGIDDSHPYIGKIPDKNKKDFTLNKTVLDKGGHGTHVAGIIMASRKRTNIVLNDIFQSGIAPDVDLYVGKVLYDDGSGYDSDIIAGIDWCINTIKADIVSMSIGGDDLYKSTCDKDVMCPVINSYKNSESIIVVASGNDGSDGGNAPGCCSNSVDVGAAENENVIAWFSGCNTEVDITAMGYKILSTMPKNKIEERTGTSMSTPSVAGSLAILKSIKPTAKKTELLNALYKTATHIKNAKKNCEGNGLVNVYSACNYLLNIKEKTNLASCSETQYSNEWIRIPYFQETKKNVAISKLCKNLIKSDCEKYVVCGWKNNKCIATGGGPVYETSFNINNYFYHSSTQNINIEIDNTFVFVGKIGEKNAYFKGNKVYVQENNMYAIWDNLITNNANEQKKYEEIIKKDILNNNYKTMGILTRLKDNRCANLFKFDYSIPQSTKTCEWYLK